MKKFRQKKNSSEKTVQNDFAETSKVVRLNWQVEQSIGKKRSHMEDATLALSTEVRASGRFYSCGIFMVADGMGGHMNGEVASRLAIQVTSEQISQSILQDLMMQSGQLGHENIEQALTQAVEEAQKVVLEEVPGGGTTLILALLINKTLYYAHVGDSRLYMQSGSQGLHVLTRDHSLVQRLVELGQISADEAVNHPQRNVLFRALGQQEGFNCDVGHLELKEPSMLLLCSDGLWDLVDDEVLAQNLSADFAIEEKARKLTELANDAGGTDNISVIIVNIT